MKTARTDSHGSLQRRDLIAILAYVNSSGSARKCVDGTYGNAEVHLDRLAAAAGMQ